MTKKTSSQMSAQEKKDYVESSEFLAKAFFRGETPPIAMLVEELNSKGWKSLRGQAWTEEDVLRMYYILSRQRSSIVLSTEKLVEQLDFLFDEFVRRKVHVEDLLGIFFRSIPEGMRIAEEKADSLRSTKRDFYHRKKKEEGQAKDRKWWQALSDEQRAAHRVLGKNYDAL